MKHNTGNVGFHAGKRVVSVRSLLRRAAWFAAGLALAGSGLAAPVGARSPAPPDPGPTLVRSFNDLEKDRWVEAWHGFQRVQACSQEDLTAFARRVQAAQAPTFRESLAGAFALARLERAAEAVSLLDRQISAHSGSTLSYELKAMVLLQDNRCNEAWETLLAVPKEAAGTPHGLMLRAYVLLRQGKYDEARAALNAEWPSIESSFLAWNVRGFLRAIQGQHSDAIKDFDRALELNPDFQAAKENRLFTELVRARGVFAMAASNANGKAKGLWGVSGTANLKLAYDRKSGWSGSLELGGKAETAKWMRKGLYARIDATREDVQAKGSDADLSSAMSGQPGLTSGTSSGDGAVEPALTCPLLIWN